MDGVYIFLAVWCFTGMIACSWNFCESVKDGKPSAWWLCWAIINGSCVAFNMVSAKMHSGGFN